LYDAKIRRLARQFKYAIMLDTYEGTWYFSIGAEDECIFEVKNISPELIKIIMGALAFKRLKHELQKSYVGMNNEISLYGHKYFCIKSYSYEDVCLFFVYINNEDKYVRKSMGYRRCEYDFGTSLENYVEKGTEIQFSEL